MRARFYALIVLFAAAALAFEPPVDTAGPLTVRIERPSLGPYGAGGWVKFDQPDVPFTLNVELSSTADKPLQGTLRVRVIDRWRAEPEGPVPFTLPPRGSATLAFQVSFGSGTYNALYPIHALAEFDYEGRHLVAHPILIVAPLRQTSRARPCRWNGSLSPCQPMAPWVCGANRCGANGPSSTRNHRNPGPPGERLSNSILPCNSPSASIAARVSP